MNSCQKILFFVVLALPVSIGYGGLGNPDLTSRLSDIDQKRFPMKMHKGVKMHGMEKNERFTDKQFPFKMWESEFNSLGRKRASITVEEKDPKKIRRPEKIEMKKIDSKMAPDNRRRVYLRNIDEVEKKKLTPRYRDSKVTHIDDLSRPAMSPYGQKGEPSMREINRFSFQRNHDTEEGAKVDKAGSGEKKKK